MTVTEPTRAADAHTGDMVRLTIDGSEITVMPGTLVIRAAEMAGSRVPRFCDHPLLTPAGNALDAPGSPTRSPVTSSST